MGLKVRIWISGVEYGPHSQNLGRDAGGGVRTEEKKEGIEVGIRAWRSGLSFKGGWTEKEEEEKEKEEKEKEKFPLYVKA